MAGARDCTYVGISIACDIEHLNRKTRYEYRKRNRVLILAGEWARLLKVHLLWSKIRSSYWYVSM